LVEVQRGTDGAALGERLFSGELMLSTPRLVAGRQIGNALLTVDIGTAGRTPLDIYVDDLDSPTRITVLIS
jgi:hypothetical protein